MNFFEDAKICYVYIAKGADGNFYTGVSKDPGYRIKQHNNERPGGARYTRGRIPNTLVYIEKYNSRSEALKREYEIKKFSHNDKENLIKNIAEQQDVLLSKFLTEYH